MKYCPNCHTQAVDSAKKCARCNYEFSHASYTKQYSAQTAKKCPRCGNIVSRNAVQCAQCYYVFSSNRGTGLTSVDLIRAGLPVVKDYDDKYDKSSPEEVFRAVSQGDAAAIYELASRYRIGTDGVEKDPAKAVGLYKEVLKYQNNISAFYHIGIYLIDGLGGKNKIKDGFPYLDAAYRLGDARAAIQIGTEYESGVNIPQDYEKALRYYLFAVNHGRKDSWFDVGDLYDKQGKHVKAKECYEKAMAFENRRSLAALNLGLYYESGKEGIPKDSKKALFYYQTAYKSRKDENETCLTAYALGLFFFREENGAVNDRKAFELLKEAADLGYCYANLYIGFYYGVGIEDYLAVDCKKAFSCLNNVHESQKPVALYYQGVIYYHTLHDVEKARTVLATAARAGSEDAKKLLNEINNSRSAPVRSQEEEAEALKRAAESCSSPGAMIRYSQVLFDSDKTSEALNLLREAYAHFPNDLDVIDCYACMMDYRIYITYKAVGLYGNIRNDCNETLRLISILKSKNHEAEKFSRIEHQMMYLLGLSYYKNKEDTGKALDYFSKSDITLSPFAAVLTALIHIDNKKAYNNLIRNDEKKLKTVLDSKNWENKLQKAAAYYVLSLIYNSGAPGVPKNLTFAHYYIQECGKLDPEMARDEIKKYSKGLLGTIKYTP